MLAFMPNRQKKAEIPIMLKNKNLKGDGNEKK
jgi:hypothetical protein